MKQRLVAGTINHWPDDDEWQNTHLDVSARPIWDRESGCVDPDLVADIAELSGVVSDSSFDEVRCHHVLEHLPLERALMALDELARILKPGGVLDIEVPNIVRVAEAIVAGDLTDPAARNQWLYGEETVHYESSDTHRSAWDPQQLLSELGGRGFALVEEPQSGYSVRFIVVKP